MEKGKLLAIDYGAKSIGLAVSDRDRMMAFGRGKIVNKNLEQVLDELFRLLNDEEIVRILIGLPLGEDGEETPQTLRIRDFGERLSNFLKQKGLNILMEYVDESFSSFEANQILRDLGVKGLDRKKTEDELAAMILIHRYIDFRP